MLYNILNSEIGSQVCCIFLKTKQIKKTTDTDELLVQYINYLPWGIYAQAFCYVLHPRKSAKKETAFTTRLLCGCVHTLYV